MTQKEVWVEVYKATLEGEVDGMAQFGRSYSGIQGDQSLSDYSMARADEAVKRTKDLPE